MGLTTKGSQSVNEFLRKINTSGLIIIAALSLQSRADDFQDIAIYDDVKISNDTSVDQTAVEDIADAIGHGADDLPAGFERIPASSEAKSKSSLSSSEMLTFSNATPEPQYDSGLSELGNKHVKKHKTWKAKKTAKFKGKLLKKGKKVAQTKRKKSGKNPTLARN